MSDYLKRAFRSQLTSTIDSLLKTTLIEITRIFEDSLHDHQVELAKKTEQISKLQIKLELSENKLSERGSSDLGLDNKKASGDSQDRLQTNVGISPDINYGVPDWCAPLDCEVVDIQSPWTTEIDGQCPSVSLRPLSVSLLRIPDIKQEVEDDYKSTLGSSLKKELSPRRNWKHSYEDVHKVNLSSASKRRRVRTKLAMQEKPEQDKISIRKSGRHHPGISKFIKNDNKRTDYVYESEHLEEQEANSNNSVKTYRCKFCHMYFDTEFGRSVHIRSHKKCKLCQKVFPYPSFLRIHMKSCLKYRGEGTSKIVELVHQEKHESTKTTSPTISNPVLPMENQHTEEDNPVTSPIIPPTEHNCISSQKTTLAEDHKASYKKHKPFTCNICSRRFRMKTSLKMHILNIHSNKSLVANGDLPWISSSEEVEENVRKVHLPMKEQSVAGERKYDSRSRHRRKRRSKIWWQKLGERAPGGFVCSVCNKTLSCKQTLESHFRIHTGEKPISCDLCHETFRCPQLKWIHKKKHHGMTIKRQRKKIYEEERVL